MPWKEKLSRNSVWEFSHFSFLSFRVNLIKFCKRKERRKKTPTTLLKATARNKWTRQKRTENFHEKFPISVAKMYRVIRYGELTKWSCLSNEVIEYTKGKRKEDKKSSNGKRAFDFSSPRLLLEHLTWKSWRGRKWVEKSKEYHQRDSFIPPSKHSASRWHTKN